MNRKPRIMGMLAGAVALLYLNFHRDLNFALKNLTWITIESKTLHKTLMSPGVIEAIQVETVKSQVDETVLKKFAAEGQAVEKGQPLMELSRIKVMLDYEQKQNAFQNAQADYKKAVREAAIQKKLYASHAVAASQVEDAIRAAQRAQASLSVSSREFDIGRQQLESTVVKAPIKGVVLKDFTTLGGAVTPGKEIVTVGDISRFLVRTKVDELDIRQVHVGQNVDIRADAYPDKQIKGVVRTIATQAERDVFAKIEVLIDITDWAGATLKHNLSVQVNIVTNEIPKAIGIPSKAIQRKRGDKAWVIVQNDLKMFGEKQITLGQNAGEEIQVIEGLSPGDRVGVTNIVNDESGL